jgi:hypothetical protein
MIIVNQHDEERYLLAVHRFMSDKVPEFTKIHLFLENDFYHFATETGNRIKPLEGGSLISAQETAVCTILLWSPQELVVHNRGGKIAEYLINILTDMFLDRLQICKGCPLCR